jgi:hypothetical protein
MNLMPPGPTPHASVALPLSSFRRCVSLPPTRFYESSPCCFYPFHPAPGFTFPSIPPGSRLATVGRCRAIKSPLQCTPPSLPSCLRIIFRFPDTLPFVSHLCPHMYFFLLPDSRSPYCFKFLPCMYYNYSSPARRAFRRLTSKCIAARSCVYLSLRWSRFFFLTDTYTSPLIALYAHSSPLPALPNCQC